MRVALRVALRVQLKVQLKVLRRAALRANRPATKASRLLVADCAHTVDRQKLPPDLLPVYLLPPYQPTNLPFYHPTTLKTKVVFDFSNDGLIFFSYRFDGDYKYFIQKQFNWIDIYWDRVVDDNFRV